MNIKYKNKQQEYWANPFDEPNSPIAYSKHNKRSDYLLSVLPKYVKPQEIVLEIGCNIGRNLNALFTQGYTNLTGIDINEDALNKSQQVYPGLKAKLINTTVEDWSLEDDKYDCIYSMAVMIHLPYESDWIFEKISGKARKTLITIEDEKNMTWKHFPRNYKEVFTQYGWREVFSEELDGPDALKGYKTRVFKRKIFNLL
jgi:2-polyprenyl-3-methyl-5-hydroxy-6-metoxy-1,4-benzoquinol methylase